MRLFISTASPFARKCRIVARERGLAPEVEEVVADPYADDPALLAANPIVQVPTLIARDGLPISDSPLICEYLDGLGQAGTPLLPADAPARLAVKRFETLGNAALEMGVKLVLEKRRPEAERSPSWIGRWTANLNRSLDALEAAVSARPAEAALDMGSVTAAVAMTWLDFRHPNLKVDEARPALAALTAWLEARPSFTQTYPR